MGGDGSLATTIKFLRTNKTIDAGLIKGKVVFCMLPFGTGNDGPQVFGWGSSPSSELWLSDLESLMRDMILSSTESLSLWNCNVEGKVLSASGETLDSKILMCYYFNLGIDAEVGIDVERNRTRRRCCNYLLYGFFAIRKFG
jgi:diacylglycerol kinase family enzyme